jgi:hypothetical protein
MAGGKPIVSTSIADVVHHFTPVVAVADDPARFIAAVRDAIERPNAALIARGVEQARENSWESIVSRMQRVMDRSLAGHGNWRTLGTSVARDAFSTNGNAKRSAASIQGDAVA